MEKRSQKLWLILGDRNTNYFHAVTWGRRTVNKFFVIEDVGVGGFYEEAKITEVITTYFQELFTSQPYDGTETV